MKHSSAIAKNAVTRNVVASSVQIAIGYIFAFICGLVAIIGAATTGLAKPIDVAMIAIFLVLFIVSVLQILRGKRSKKLIILFREYAARLANDPLHSMVRLASGTGAPLETVRKNILEMIRRGFFVSAYIDSGRNCIVFSQENSLDEPNGSAVQQMDCSAVYFRVSCPGCGAKNKIQKGTVGECEFCGTYLAEK